MILILLKLIFLKLLFKFIVDIYIEILERVEKDIKFSCSYLFLKYVIGS